MRVWDPLYAKVTRDRPPPPGNGDSDRKGTPPMVSYQDAWAKARRRAAEALTRDTIQPEYRRMVREFFAEGR